MTSTEQTLAPQPTRPFASLEERVTRLIYLDGEAIAYGVIFILAILTRFWGLGDRVMSHDESLHTRYSWNLYRGEGFSHTPLMHGPLLFHMTALSYLLFGDNDFSARIYPAIVGVLVTMAPIFMKRWLGKTGAIATSVLLLVSPLLLYYSRYIRHDMPAILFALVMAICTWRYIEERKNWYLLVLAGAQSALFASKEVSFIYVAIFGSFLTIFFLVRLLDVEWARPKAYRRYAILLIVVLVLVAAFGGYTLLKPDPTAIDPGAVPPPTDGTLDAVAEPTDWIALGLIGALGIAVVAMAITVMRGQWQNLRHFPELDVMIVMGTLVLPMLSPFLIHGSAQVGKWMLATLPAPPDFAVAMSTFNPMDETPRGVNVSAAFTFPVVAVSVIAGMLWGMRPPEPRRVRMPASTLPEDEQIDGDSVTPTSGLVEVEVQPDLLDWLQAFSASRWLAIGAVYWVIFFFFFTTMFTNGAGLGTGVVGSLGYWLEQQEVKRGNQPWYYYLLVIMPIYEFLPVILASIAGVLGLSKLAQRLFRRPISVEETADNDTAIEPVQRPLIDLDAPIRFPVLLFIGYWSITNLIAYSIAGEKMPWLGTHLTFPLILLGGWVLGRVIDRINWRQLWTSSAWAILFLLPVLAIAGLRFVGPVCSAIAFDPAQVQAADAMAAGEVSGASAADIARGIIGLPCSTIIPEQFQGGIFQGYEIAALSATYGWVAAVVVLLVTMGLVNRLSQTIDQGQFSRLVGLGLVAWLGFMTMRTAWVASFIRYDEATEYLVYAHSAGAVKDVMAQVEEISFKTTDGYGLRVAYDNKVSWPYSWYLRDYYNAVFYGAEPSRGLIGDSPVILAGPDNWAKVEALLGDRYYQFEYIRMWWPMQDYFDLTKEEFADFATDPQLQRGIWEIFTRRNYDTYAEAAGAYRASVPNFEISEWPVAERMRMYIRKDVFAEVWDYGVAASEIARAIDPYAEGARQLSPDQTFGEGVLNRPHGVAISTDGLIYVADSQNHRVAVFDQQGVLVRTMGGYGLAPAPGVLNDPWDVAVGPTGEVYVADTWNHRIVEFSSDGDYVRDWGYEGAGVDDPMGFWGPRGIAVDAEGRVYLSDTGNKRIQVFDADGNRIRQIGTGGGALGQVDEPAGMAIGPDGLLYVADTWNQRIQVFSPDGNYVRDWYVDAWFAQTNERPYLFVDETGQVYVTDPEGSRVIVFDSVGQYLFSFGDFNTIGLAGSVVYQDGVLYVVDSENGSIQRYPIGDPTLPDEFEGR